MNMQKLTLEELNKVLGGFSGWNCGVFEFSKPNSRLTLYFENEQNTNELHLFFIESYKGPAVWENSKLEIIVNKEKPGCYKIVDMAVGFEAEGYDEAKDGVSHVAASPTSPSIAPETIIEKSKEGIMSRNYIFWIGVIDTVIIIIAIFLTKQLGSFAYLTGAMGIVSMVTFFGVMSHGENTTDETLFRRAITFSVITVYLLLVSSTVFLTKEIGSTKISETMLASFTSIVGVVVAFYFGSSAYVEGKRIQSSKEKTTTASKDSDK